MREAWQVLMQKAKIPFRYIRHREGKPERTGRAIGPRDLVILLNDHHLSDLTKYLLGQGGFGQGRDERVWLGIATERVMGSPFPKSQEKTRACAQLCHLVAHFDPAAGRLIQSEGAEPVFMHQYVDAFTFQSKTPFRKKRQGVFWVGKLPEENIPKEYDSRVRCFEAVRQQEGFSWRRACRPDLSINKIVRERDSYKALLNLPSNCPGYTATFFEHLAMGAVVLQYRTPFPHPEGLQPGKHFLEYDSGRPAELLSLIQEVAGDPDRYETMAAEARKACLQRHTLAHRMEFLLQKACLVLSGPGASGVGPAAREILVQAREKIAHRHLIRSTKDGPRIH
jgi:hypothetical protein